MSGRNSRQHKAAAEEKTEFAVELSEADADKIKVIKIVPELTGLGLKEAKEAGSHNEAHVHVDIRHECNGTFSIITGEYLDKRSRIQAGDERRMKKDQG